MEKTYGPVYCTLVKLFSDVDSIDEKRYRVAAEELVKICASNVRKNLISEHPVTSVFSELGLYKLELACRLL